MPMPKMTFAKGVLELLQLSTGHGALLLFGPGFALQAQQGLKPPGHCGALAHYYYDNVVISGVLFVFAAFGSYVACHYVKGRTPEAADGGLQGLTATERIVLRAIAALGLVLSITASLLAVSTFTNVLLTKLGRFNCLPGAVRGGLFSAYLVVGGTLAVTYLSDAKAIILSED